MQRGYGAGGGAAVLRGGSGGESAAANAVPYSEAMQQLHMSARAYHRILKLARTIADPSAALRASLAGNKQIQTVHLAEAIQYRPRRPF